MTLCGEFPVAAAVHNIAIGDFLFSSASILVHIIEASETIRIEKKDNLSIFGINYDSEYIKNATEVICWIYLGMNIANILLSVLLWQAVMKWNIISLPVACEFRDVICICMESILKCISYLAISPFVNTIGLAAVIFHGLVLGKSPYYYALAMYPSYWTYKLFSFWMTNRFLVEIRASPSERRRRRNDYSRIDDVGETNEAFNDYNYKHEHEVLELKLPKKYEILEDKLQLDYKVCLGSEEHNAVISGLLEIENGKFISVSVKTLKVTSPTIPFSNRLLQEAILMGHIGHSDYILKFFGICVKSKLKEKLFLVNEYYPKGNLDAFLKDCVDTYEGKTFINLINKHGQIDVPSEKKVYENLPRSKVEFNTIDMLSWAYQIASAMEHLHTKRVIYGCLQAKSLILINIETVKLSGFTFASSIRASSNFIRRDDLPNRFPLRWTALECITSTDNIQFTTRSDVWSYGITLWEIFSLGALPYSTCTWDTDIVRNLLNGMRLDPPTNAPAQIYEIMSACWRQDRIERPNFYLLKLFFQQLLSSLKSRTRNVS